VRPTGGKNIKKREKRSPLTTTKQALTTTKRTKRKTTKPAASYAATTEARPSGTLLYPYLRFQPRTVAARFAANPCQIKPYRPWRRTTRMKRTT
jgi:hypothetical protein